MKNLMIVFLFIVTGCSSIPPNTPLLIEKNYERIEVRSAIVTTVLQSLLDDLSLSKRDIDEIIKELCEIDISSLSDADQKSHLKQIQILESVSMSFNDWGQKAGNVPEETKRIFSTVVKDFKYIELIVKHDIDKRKFVQHLIDVIDIDKERENDK